MGRGDFVRHSLSAGTLALFGCGGSLGEVTGSTPGTDTGATSGTGGTCRRVPQETAGPYPGDGSNGANVLDQTGVARQDIRSSFAGLSGSATGAPLTIQLTLGSTSTCTKVYPQNGYSGSASILSRISLASDMVFSDGSALELATVTGSTAAGLTEALTVAV